MKPAVIAAAAEDRRRLLARWIGVVVLAGFGALVIRLFKLQIIDVTGYRETATARETVTYDARRVALVERPLRGPILDRSGLTLAESYYRHQLVVDPSMLSGRADEVDAQLHPSKAAARARRREGDLVKEARRHEMAHDWLLAVLPGVLQDAGVTFDPAALAAALGRDVIASDDGKPVVVKGTSIARGLTPTQRRLIETGLATVANDADDGETRRMHALARAALHFDDVTARQYPFGEAVVQVVGLIGEKPGAIDGHVFGQSGMERQLEVLLGGDNGFLGGERDGANRRFRFDDTFEVNPLDGVEVDLTIDGNISRIALDALKHNAEKNPCVRSTAVVLDAHTAEVLAAVSYPSTVPDGPKFNARGMVNGAVGDCLEPGSTIKPFVIAWALHKGAITPEQKFDCGGPKKYEYILKQYIEEYSVNPEPLTAREIIMRSSNVGATRIGLEKLGLPGMFEAFRAYHFAGRPGSLLPNESQCYFTPEKTDRAHGIRGATESSEGTRFPRGYMIRMSPLALASWYTVFTNNGDRLTPTVVREMRRNGVTKTFPTERVASGLDQASIDYVLGGMELVVDNARGTGNRTARSTKYTMLGKTGTSQYEDKHTPRGQEYNAWMVGIAPAHDPKLIVVVVHHRVKNRGPGTYTGGVVSGPVLKEIVENTLESLGLAHDRPPEEAAPGAQSGGTHR